MRISPKEASTFLPAESYEILAVNAGSIEYYLIQNDDLEFIWLESKYFDKRTIENEPALFKEVINDYHYYLVPEHLKQSNRNFEKEIKWNLQGNEFYERVLFALNMKSNGYNLNPNTEEILTNTFLQFSVIEQQIESLGKTILLLSDGYFPSLISLSIVNKTSVLFDVDKQFTLDFHQMGKDQKAIVSDVTNISACLNELFDWSYNWLKDFTNFPKLFSDPYWNNQLLEMLHISTNNLTLYSKLNAIKITKYFLLQADGTEINLLQIDTKKDRVTLRIQNVIH